MKKLKTTMKLLLGCIACTAALSAAGASAALAQTTNVPMSEPVFIYGTIHRDGNRLSMTNIQGDTTLDELILNVSEETRILDALSGFPVSKDDLKDGENVYAYISHAMTMSLPPQSHAEMIICQVPADYAAPLYETVDSLSAGTDGSYVLKTVRGNEYQIDAATTLLPYLTRNIVTVNDLTQGRSVLIWRVQSALSVSQTASKIVMFPAGQAKEQTAAGPASDPELINKAQLQ